LLEGQVRTKLAEVGWEGSRGKMNPAHEEIFRNIPMSYYWTHVSE